MLGEYCAYTSTPECTGWAMLALLRAYEAGVCVGRDALRVHMERALARGAQQLVRTQLANGDWAQGNLAGIFNGSCSINYGNYKNVFPIWCLAEYARLCETKEE